MNHDFFLQFASESNNVVDRLEQLCYDFGHRLAGAKDTWCSRMSAVSSSTSPHAAPSAAESEYEGPLERAIEWAADQMSRVDGLEEVHCEPCEVPNWQRGLEEWCQGAYEESLRTVEVTRRLCVMMSLIRFS